MKKRVRAGDGRHIFVCAFGCLLFIYVTVVILISNILA